MQDITQYNSMTIEEVATRLNDILENKFVPAADAMHTLMNGTMAEHWKGDANKVFLDKANAFHEKDVQEMREKVAMHKNHYKNVVASAAEETTAYNKKQGEMHYDAGLGTTDIDPNSDVGSGNLLI